MARSPDEETEDTTDCSETDDSAGNSDDSCEVVRFESNADADCEKTNLNLTRTMVERSGETGDDDGGAVPNDSDDSNLVDDSSLTANEAENAVSAEAGDQTDLSRRTVVASAGNLITGEFNWTTH